MSNDISTSVIVAVPALGLLAVLLLRSASRARPPSARAGLKPAMRHAAEPKTETPRRP